MKNFGDIIKNGEKVGKSIFLRKIRPCSRGCKASFYLKTIWQAFIFQQKKSFKQLTSEIRGGRYNCLVSWRGMTPLSVKMFDYSYFLVNNNYILLLTLFYLQT